MEVKMKKVDTWIHFYESLMFILCYGGGRGLKLIFWEKNEFIMNKILLNILLD